jgi:cell wall-associated NlpC family hydrolase
MRTLLACACLGFAVAAAAQEHDPIGQLARERGWAADAPPAARNPSSEVVVAAMNYLGVQYARGGNGFEQGFDCSGFTRHVYANTLGHALPRRSEEQARAPGLAAVERAELQPGDLVFFNTLGRSYSHVGLYVGDGRFIHAPRSGAQVRVEDMRSRYWAQRYDGARRAATLLASRPPTVVPPAAADGPSAREPIAFVL